MNIYSTWNKTNNSWSYSLKEVFEYDLQTDYNDLSIPLAKNLSSIINSERTNGSPFIMKNKPLHSKTYTFDSSNNFWEMQNDLKFNYSGEISNIPNDGNDLIKVYPNIVSDVLKIESNFVINTFTITNLHGVEVVNCSINKSQENINLTNLSSGIYFYILKQNNYRKYGTIIKK